MPGPYKAFHQITDIVDSAAARFKTKDAFRFNDDALTYEQLVKKSRQLTSVLLKNNIKKGDRVGIFLHPCLETPIAIYGILGAGACFVPIDPFTPAQRIRQITEKCAIKQLVTHPAAVKTLKQLLSQDCHLETIIGLEENLTANVDHISWARVWQADATPPIRVNELDLAYIMFTSGSTGTPKGMIHTHANGMIYADNLASEHNLKSSDIFLNLAPLHFDMAVMDFFACPMVGGTTIIVPQAHSRMPASLTALAAKEKATIWYSVPFAMTQMLQYGAMDKHDLSSLRWMIYGGEAIALKHLRGLMHALPNARFCNAYGPAETHQVSSYNIDQVPDETLDVIPIGKPWKTVDILIVDKDDTQVQPGQTGELLVRAPSCMRGYWGDAEKTKKAFFRKQLIDQIYDTYYRTGDLVSQQSDGMMFFHGRKDRQIKVRGFRIELDEVEAVLSSYETVKECAVVTSPDHQSLIAIMTTKTCAPIDQMHVIKHCQKTLPPYAVPSQVLVVKDFPRTTSQKINRSRLKEEIQQSAL